MIAPRTVPWLRKSSANRPNTLERLVRLPERLFRRHPRLRAALERFRRRSVGRRLGVFDGVEGLLFVLVAHVRRRVVFVVEERDIVVVVVGRNKLRPSRIGLRLSRCDRKSFDPGLRLFVTSLVGEPLQEGDEHIDLRIVAVSLDKPLDGRYLLRRAYAVVGREHRHGVVDLVRPRRRRGGEDEQQRGCGKHETFHDATSLSSGDSSPGKSFFLRVDATSFFVVLLAVFRRRFGLKVMYSSTCA